MRPTQILHSGASAALSTRASARSGATSRCVARETLRSAWASSPAPPRRPAVGVPVAVRSAPGGQLGTRLECSRSPRPSPSERSLERRVLPFHGAGRAHGRLRTAQSVRMPSCMRHRGRSIWLCVRAIPRSSRRTGPHAACSAAGRSGRRARGAMPVSERKLGASAAPAPH